MGTSESKEEVIIAQAGNGNDAKIFESPSTAEILGIIAFFIVILLLIAQCWSIYKKRLTKKIRKDLSKSMAFTQSTEQI